MNIQDGICIHDGCDKPKYSKGLCRTHYHRRLNGTAMDKRCVECDAIIPIGTPGGVKLCLKCRAKPCNHDGCDEPRDRAGLCETHYGRRWDGRAMDRRCLECDAIIPMGTYGKVKLCLKCMAKPCSHDGCDEPGDNRTSGLCRTHYDRRWRGRAMDKRCVECDTIIPIGTHGGVNRCLKCMAKPCSHDGCGEPRYRAGDLCLTHYGRQEDGRAMDNNCVECEAIIPAGTSSNVNRCLKCMAKPCKYDGCDKPRYEGGAGHCSTHYQRRKRGKAMDAMDRKPIPIGAIRTNSDGYIRVKVSDKGRWPLQHRHKMEKELGRPLEKYETVHHKNTVKHDNDIKNLELWSHSHLPGGRVEDRINYYVEQIYLYANDLADRANLLGIRDRTIAGLP